MQNRTFNDKPVPHTTHYPPQEYTFERARDFLAEGGPGDTLVWRDEESFQLYVVATWRDYDVLFLWPDPMAIGYYAVLRSWLIHARGHLEFVMKSGEIPPTSDEIALLRATKGVQ